MDGSNNFKIKLQKIILIHLDGPEWKKTSESPPWCFPLEPYRISSFSLLVLKPSELASNFDENICWEILCWKVARVKFFIKKIGCFSVVKKLAGIKICLMVKIKWKYLYIVVTEILQLRVKYQTSMMLYTRFINSFVSNAPFLYPLKTENRKVFLFFQGV